MSKKNRDRKYGAGEGKVGPANEMTKFYWILGIVAIAGVAIVSWSVGSKAMSSAVSAPIELPELAAAELMDLTHAVTLGDANAPIRILEFADFQCPGCGQFAREVKPLIQAEFVATGAAKFEYYTFPLVSIHPHAFLAARASLCADDQGKFWEYHDILFRNQGRWSTATSAAGTFDDYAEELGLDTDAFSDCVNSDKHADVVTANMELGYQLQIGGTPTVLVSQGQGIGRRVAPNIEAVREAVAAIQSGG